ncbi:hypothetical protein B9Z55_024801 [Caenorhabditis nigoni]|uniref:Uncharacterized protein n=1 Tax=Caenorhabditis nigoni TaxID=1611254 RepID=A0A2G5SVR9_9PELO|nr:hypothetical protein B9Z55_024801 [Caenorhabditis nigoni]
MSSGNNNVNTKLDFDESNPKPASVYLGSLKEFFKETAPNATVEQQSRLNNLLLSMIQMNHNIFKNQQEATFRKVENMKDAVKKFEEKTEEIKREILQGPREAIHEELTELLKKRHELQDQLSDMKAACSSLDQKMKDEMVNHQEDMEKKAKAHRAEMVEMAAKISELQEKLSS